MPKQASQSRRPPSAEDFSMVCDLHAQVNLARGLRRRIWRGRAVGCGCESARTHVIFALPDRDQPAEEPSPVAVAFEEVHSEQRQVCFVLNQRVRVTHFLPAVPLRRRDEGIFLRQRRPSRSRRLSKHTPDDIADTLLAF